MTTHELIALLNAAEVYPEELIFVKNDEDGKVFTIMGITKDPSCEDGPGTVWVNVSEF